MNIAVNDQKKIYHEVNSVTGSVNSVIFGTETLAELPVSELVQDFGLNISVCNRSVEEALLADAFELLDECVYELQPAKVFLNFGETDLRCEDFSVENFLREYRRLIKEICSRVRGRVYVVSVLSESDAAVQLNTSLCKLAQEMGCSFVNAADIFRYEKPRLRLFGELVHHMRDARISFSEAMHFCDA